MKWLNVSLRTQLVTIISGIVAIFLVMTLLLGWQMRRSFLSLERENVALHLQQVQSAFYRELARLESMTADWAPWDETVRFVEGNYPEFVDVNLPDSLFSDVQINLFVIADARGEIKYARTCELADGHMGVVPEEVLPLVRPGGIFSQFKDERDCRSGIYILPEQVLLATSRPVVTTAYEGPIRGTLLIGVWVDERLLQELRDVTELPFTFCRQDGAEPKCSVSPPLQPGVSPRITPLSLMEVRGETLLPDLGNRNALVIALTLPRDVYRQGVTLYLWYVAIGMASALTVIVLIALFMRRRVLDRLERLAGAIQRIEQSGDFTLRAPESRHSDEIGRITGQFNRMMERLHEQELAIAEKEALFSGVLRTAADGVILIDEKGRIIEYNGAAAVIFGYTPEEALGKSVGILMPEPHNRQHDQYIRRYLETGEAQIIGSTREVLGRRKDGTIFPMTLAVSEVKRPGKPPVFAGIVRDITEHKRNEELLRHAATHDSLTQLLNRRRFEERLSVEVHSAHRYGHALSLAMIDIDYFKQINDTYGHQAGDAVLTAIARIIREDIRLDDFAGRYGGDELCIGFPHTPSISAVNCVERIRSRIKDLTFTAENGSTFKVTLSIGIAQLTFEYKDTRMLFMAADEALYEAKKNGRDRIVVH